MNKINFALLSALFDSKETNLYREIYFPIIKYAIINLYNQKGGLEYHYDLMSLKNKINEEFGLLIPSPVIKNALIKIEKNSNDVQLQTFDNGAYFKVQSTLSGQDACIKEKSLEVQKKLDLLEENFSLFLKNQNLTSEKKLMDFFSEYTEEIMLYLNEGKEKPLVNEEYVNVMRFISDIKEKNADLYSVVNSTLWGAVIAGFLQRGAIDFAIKPKEKIDYYLDTQLVLSILKLDCEENFLYAHEMLNIIKKAGATPKIHSMTLAEINRILYSVAQNGPWPNTPIEMAFIQNNYANSNISHILNHLKQYVEKEGIVVDYITEQQIQDAVKKYKTSKRVNLLQNERKRNFSSIATNGEDDDLSRDTKQTFWRLKDIHDVFMCDYVAAQRNRTSSVEKIPSYFVSLNTDLIAFADATYSSSTGQVAVHPSKVIIDLWLHGADGSVFRKNILIEVMARCYSLNNMDARRKMAVISEYYNSEKFEKYDENDAKEFLKLIVNRSRDAIDVVNEMEQNGSDKAVVDGSIQKLLDLVQKSNKENDAVNQKMQYEMNQLRNEINSVRDAASVELNKQKSLNDEEIKRLEREKNEAIQKERDEKNRSNKEYDEKFQKERCEKIEAEKKLLDNMTKECRASISMKSYWIWIILEWVGVLLLVLSVGWFLYSYLLDKRELSFNVYQIITFAIGLLVFATRSKNMYMLKPIINYKNIKDEQIKFWKEKNPDYDKYKMELEKDGVDVSSYL